MNISSAFSCINERFFEDGIASISEFADEYGTALLTTVFVALLVFQIRAAYSDHRDSTEFSAAFDRAYERYKIKLNIQNRDKLFPDAKSKARKHLKRGICFGLTSAFFSLVHNNPNQSPTELAKKVLLDDAICDQLIYREVPDRLYSRRPVDGSNWCPYESLGHIIPWREETSVYQGALEGENVWEGHFYSEIHGGEDLMARVSFKVCNASGHTFAFWKKGSEFGIFDYGSVYRYKDAKCLFKAIRERVLDYRASTKRAKNEEERAYYRYFPIAVLRRV